MFKKFFGKKENETNEETPPKEVKKYSKPLEIKNEEPIPEIQEETQKLTKKQSFELEQASIMGTDIKEEAQRFSKAFFNSKNAQKSEAYMKFQHFLTTLDELQKSKIKRMTYLEFKESEVQVNTLLKNGFSQYLTKGATLNDTTRQTVEFIFGDIKKLASRGHRYWYYSLYMWQRKED